MAAFSLPNLLLLFSLAHESCRGSSLCKYNDFERSTANCVNLRLRGVPGHLNSNLIRLDLPKNEIKSLTEKSFSRYPNLESLQLQSNYISDIHPLTFLRLKYLTSLYLDQNQFENLNFSLWLRTACTRGSWQSFPRKVFRGYTSLEKCLASTVGGSIKKFLRL